MTDFRLPKTDPPSCVFLKAYTNIMPLFDEDHTNCTGIKTKLEITQACKTHNSTVTVLNVVKS